MTSFIHIAERQHWRHAGPAPVVWVPGEAVTSHLLTVPPVKRAKWLAMVPWLLEERLLEAPDSIVFRAGDRDGGGAVPVVVTGADRLVAWQQALTEAGRDYRELVPDYFALPWREGEVSLALLGDRCLVRFDRWRGAAGSTALILGLVRARLAANTGSVVVYHEGERPRLENRGDESWQYRHVARVLAPDHRDWLAIDGGGAVTRQWSWSPAARVASLLLAVLLGLVAAVTLVENRQTRAQANFLQSELRRGYQLYFGESYDFAMADFQRVVSSRLVSGDGRARSAVATVAGDLAGLLRACPNCRLERLQLASGRAEALVSGDNVGTELQRSVTGGRGFSLAPEGDRWRLTWPVEGAR